MQRGGEKPFPERKPVLGEELLAAMKVAENRDELHGEADLFVCALQLERLVYGHFGILVAVNQQQRWIIRIDVRDRAGEPGKRGILVGLAAKKKQ